MATASPNPTVTHTAHGRSNHAAKHCPPTSGAATRRPRATPLRTDLPARLLERRHVRTFRRAPRSCLSGSMRSTPAVQIRYRKPSPVLGPFARRRQVPPGSHSFSGGPGAKEQPAVTATHSHALSTYNAARCPVQASLAGGDEASNHPGVTQKPTPTKSRLLLSA
jgi:hypothetical protein